MKTQVIWIDLETTVKDAAKIMFEKNIGSLIIMDNSKIAGIITRTDLLKTINI